MVPQEVFNEKVSPKKQENKKGDTNTISQKPNPKYNKGTVSHYKNS